PGAVDATPSRLATEAIELTAKDLLGLTYATSQLVADSPQTFVQLLERSFQDETSSVLLEERVRGVGASGEFLGILNASATIVAAKEGGQAADSLTAQNILDVRARTWGYGRAVWIVNIDHYASVVKMAIPIGTGGIRVPIWEAGDD